MNTQPLRQIASLLDELDACSPDDEDEMLGKLPARLRAVLDEHRMVADQQRALALADDADLIEHVEALDRKLRSGEPQEPGLTSAAFAEHYGLTPMTDRYRAALEEKPRS